MPALRGPMIDVAIIGGGIIGLSTAWQLQGRHPGASLAVIEKEPAVARHQSGRNSGVIHSGIYYEPGSLKARFCKAGVDATIRFCRDHGIAFEQRGKLIVATDALEENRLRMLEQRARSNRIDARWLGPNDLRQAEPGINGVGALLLTTPGIVDYAAICRKMAELFEQFGGHLRLGAAVTAIEEGSGRMILTLERSETVSCRFLVACGGLMADRLARMQGLDADFRILPYRGEYYRLAKQKNDIVHHLIYPVPDPALPFLGVHLTPTIDGCVTLGPNALPGFKREGYGRFNLSLRDTWEQLTYAGFWRVTKRHARTGFAELRDALWKTGYIRQVQKYCPQISVRDLRPHPAGVRAMAVTRDGSLVNDFLIAESPHSLHVCSAPSPAATSAIPIGHHLCNRIDERLFR